MIFPRNSIGNPAMIGVSGIAISFSFGGVLVTKTGGRGAGAADIGVTGAMGADAATGRGASAGAAAGASMCRRIPRSKPANFDLTMFDMTFFFELA